VDDPARTAEVEADARALASVLRMRILRLCLDEPMTNKEIATRLGKDPATTYHHVRTLTDRGFLAAQPERRGTRGAREVPYLATRKSWRTPIGPSGNRVLIETFLEEVAEADPATVDDDASVSGSTPPASPSSTGGWSRCSRTTRTVRPTPTGRRTRSSLPCTRTPRAPTAESGPKDPCAGVLQHVSSSCRRCEPGARHWADG